MKSQLAKIISALSLLLILQVSARGQNDCDCPPAPTICEKNLVTDFHAAPNNANFAIERAVRLINQRGGYFKLTIPSGIYMIGAQTYTPTDVNQVFSGLHVFEFDNCTKITIVGEGPTRPLLKYFDGFYFGLFQPACLEPTSILNNQNSAHAGVAFYIKNHSSEIEINNIDLDGNSDNFYFGGNYGAGANPYEREHDGVFIEDSYKIDIKNMDIKGFGRDGIAILDNKEVNNVIVTKYIAMENVNVSYSGRNALSWVGGHHISADDCSFSHSERGFINSNPVCGLDIEPERGSTCVDGLFTDCIFENNVGYGIGSGAAAGESKDIQFKRSKFIGTTNASGITGQTLNLSFDSCKFFGSYIASEASDALIDNNDKATRFYNCEFSDCYNGNEVFTANYLIEVRAKRTLIQQCTFEAFYKPIFYISPNINCNNTADRPIVQLSTFRSYLNYPINSQLLNRASLSAFTTFSVNTFYSKVQTDFQTDITDINKCNSQDGPNFFNIYSTNHTFPTCNNSFSRTNLITKALRKKPSL